MILTKMKQTAEAHLGTSIGSAVITVPPYFKNAQRQATRDAAKIAGLEALRIMDEATAAAVTYGMESTAIGERHVLVLDIGACYFGVSLVTIEEGIYEVKSIGGDAHLGGEDFNSLLVDHFAKQFKRQHRKGLFSIMNC
jgi:heat shock protein 1/8